MSNSTKCAQCGRFVKAEFQSCPFCGRQFLPYTNPTPSAAVTRNAAHRLERLWPAIVISAALIGGIAWFVRSQVESRREQAAAVREEKLREQRVQQQISALAVSNGAVADWKTNLCGHDDASPLLTADVQESLVRAGNRPLLISGLLKDVRQADGAYVLTFSAFTCREVSLMVELSASSDEANEVLAHRSDIPPYFAFIAQAASAEKQETGSFLIRGRCLRVLFTGMEGMSLYVDESAHDQPH